MEEKIHKCIICSYRVAMIGPYCEFCVPKFYFENHNPQNKFQNRLLKDVAIIGEKISTNKPEVKSHASD